MKSLVGTYASTNVALQGMTSDAKIGALAAKMEATEKRLDKIEEMEKQKADHEPKSEEVDVERASEEPTLAGVDGVSRAAVPTCIYVCVCLCKHNTIMGNCKVEHIMAGQNSWAGVPT